MISDDIVQYMADNGLYARVIGSDSSSNYAIFATEDAKTQVLITPIGHIECRCWNDEPGAERLCTTLRVTRQCPSLVDWQMLMHIGSIVHMAGIEAFINSPVKKNAACYV